MKDGKYKILLVDDDKFLVDMYLLKFKQSGFDAEAVLGSIEALEKVREDSSYQIIVIDLIMPVMDGFQLLESIRKEKLAEKSGIVVLSNQGQQSDMDKAKEFGIDGYVIKANTIPSEVVNLIKKIAENKFGEKK